jgi:hypothetical protein
MKVIFHEDFYQVYALDPAAATGRMEAITAVITPSVDFVEATPATQNDITAVHTGPHIKRVKQLGVYAVAALAAGGAIQAATLGLNRH